MSRSESTGDVLQRIKIIHVLKGGNQRDAIHLRRRPMLDEVGKEQWLTRTGEARIYMRDRAGNGLDRAAFDASLRFRRGLGAQSKCEARYVLSCSSRVAATD
jgi:hypothetical protein